MTRKYLHKIKKGGIRINHLKILGSLKFLQNSGINTLSISNCPNLSFDLISDTIKKLEIYKCPAQISQIQNLVQLQELQLSHTKLQNISGLKCLTNITVLDLFNNRIQDISVLRFLNCITDLTLSYNLIRNLNPLYNKHTLRHLQLSCNRITDITVLSSLCNLEEIELQYNKIVHVLALANLKHLKQLDISDNHISRKNMLPLQLNPKFNQLTDDKFHTQITRQQLPHQSEILSAHKQRNIYITTLFRTGVQKKQNKIKNKFSKVQALIQTRIQDTVHAQIAMTSQVISSFSLW
ncbi:LPXTG_cell wall anchor domain-containing protein [Hexamita inflata]|uniref:LPXTG cell wall anchor domain-containing protein n=1 Tax=Hexamita inflata TaxID=28002 RepID=A0AA86N5A6_9EUKA|nr:LPXTG cell wall anchor domain-containing protein [Hexamita inflata]CAI9954437.1 LPXTG cell wall anchor domain-containing protein [Hexamita inflata]